MKNLSLILSILLVLSFDSDAQRRNKKSQTTSTVTYDESLYQDLKWRNIGPFRGGRATAVSGVASDPLTYYLGGTGGGIWKTEDGGATWKNVSDGFLNTGSVGAIAVASSDPNVIYVGMGEKCVRGVTTSSGDGVYRSTDAGQSWEHVGLENSLHISMIHVHPRNPDVAYVAVQGNPYKSSEDRGIYKTMDGGQSWSKIHFVNNTSGPSDLAMDMSNPRILYAAYWDHQRTPWQVISGGEGSSIWKSTDGGESWEKLEEGLPDLMGKIGVAVSPANPQRVWAIVEAEKGGLYRSDDGGKKWKLINGNRILQARSWYYMHVFADTQDENKVYILNAPFMKSIDGGKSFSNVSVPHGDNHALWINPNNSDVMINGNDGGANISYNGGMTWSEQDNQPTAQFYRVNVDNQFPYWVYGGQQDNSSVGTPSRSSGGGIGWKDWIAGVGGCESAYTAFDPDNPRYVYAGCYQGIITEWDKQTRETKGVMAYPFLGLGSSSKEVKYRFNWNAPIHVSQHNSSVIYHAGNKLLKSSDRGISWTEVSPDLTRNDTTKQGLGGSPITNEGAGGEVYGTIMYMAESPHDGSVIWTGSDDGLVYLTQDGGNNWQNVTPPGLPETLINSIEVSPHDPGTAYLAVTGYKFGDFSPYIYKTTDYGNTWSMVVNGISENHFVRVVREDPEKKDLLYAGTERGLLISFDGGAKWNRFQQNLPVVPITDLIVRHNDLIAATQGRAFWILDDLTPLHQLNNQTVNSGTFLFAPRDAWHTSSGNMRNANNFSLGQNPFNGAEVRYLMSLDSEEDTTEFKVEFLDDQGKVLRTFATETENNKDTVSYKPGMNTIKWNLRTKALETPKGIQPFGNTGGYKVGPGNYLVRLTYGDQSLESPLKVVKDPRYQGSESDYSERVRMIKEINTMIDDLYTYVIEMRSVNNQLKSWEKVLEEMDKVEDESLMETCKALQKNITSIENQLIQPKQKTFQDVINFLNQLDANILYLRSMVDGGEPPVTKGEKDRLNDLQTQWEAHKSEIDKLMSEDLVAFNNSMKEAGIPYIVPSTKQD